MLESYLFTTEASGRDAWSSRILVALEQTPPAFPRVRALHRDGGRGNLRIISAVSVTAHRQDAPRTVRAFVLTITDTRSEPEDRSGDAIVELLTAAGHELLGRRIVRDDPAAVRGAVKSQVANVDVIITTGGTGISARDNSYEAITALLGKQLDGFGELFRMLSFQEIGTAAMLSRACAGTLERTAVFSLPGSEHAVRLAMSKLILPEIGHLVRELRR